MACSSRRSRRSWLARAQKTLLASTTLAALVYTGGGGADLSAEVAEPRPSAPANPDMAGDCGLDFTLVLDRSGSIAKARATEAVQRGAKAFLGALVDTGSTVSLVSFSETGRVDAEPAPLTGATIGGLEELIDGLRFEGATNWEDSLIKTRSQFTAFPSQRPDLVVLLTDGKPNRYMRDNGRVATGEDQALAQAVARANEVKAGGTHLFALGVGRGLEAGNLQAVSGTDEFKPGGNFRTADWTQVSDFAQLEASLRSIATELCGGTVVVQNYVDGQKGSGWTFSASNGATPASGVTDADGMVSFKWESPVAAADVTLTPEQLYQLQSVECTVNAAPVGTRIERGVRLPVGPEDTVLCDFKNVTLPVADIALSRDPVNTRARQGQKVVHTYTVGNPGAVVLSNVQVVDNRCPDVVVLDGGDGDQLLSPGEQWQFTCSETAPRTGVSTARVTGATAGGGTVEDKARALVHVVNPAIDLVREGPTAARPGDVVTYVFTVTNVGDVDLGPITVEDSLLGEIGTVAGLVPGQQVVLKKEYRTPADQVGDLESEGRACTTSSGAGDHDPPLCATAEGVLDVIHPAVSLDAFAVPDQLAPPGDVTYTFVAKNTGDVLLVDVTVTDDVHGYIGTFAQLAPGEEATLTKTVTVTASSPSRTVARVQASEPLGGKVADTDDTEITPVLSAAEVPAEPSPAVASPADAAPEPAGPEAPERTPSAVEPAAESAPAVAADAAQDGSTLPITGTGLVGRVSSAGVVLALAGLMVSGLVRRRRPS